MDSEITQKEQTNLFSDKTKSCEFGDVEEEVANLIERQKMVHEEFKEGFDSKLYYTGFVTLKEYSGKGRHLLCTQRVYFEIQGNFINWWSAGHCDVDKGTVTRLKKSANPFKIPLNSLKLEFNQEDKTLDSSGGICCGCFSFKRKMEEWCVAVNDGEPANFEFAFLNYSVCAKFYCAANLAMTEHVWLHSIYSKSVVNEAFDNSNNRTGSLLQIQFDQSKHSSLHSSLFIKVPVSTEWKSVYCELTGYENVFLDHSSSQVTQKVASTSIKKCSVKPFDPKKSPLKLNLYEDSKRNKLIGTIVDFSYTFLILNESNNEETNNMNIFILRDCIFKRKNKSTHINLPERISCVQFASSNPIDILKWVTNLSHVAKLLFPIKQGNEQAQLKEVVPEDVPLQSTKLFLESSEVANVDIVFQTEMEIKRTFMSLLRAKESAAKAEIKNARLKRSKKSSVQNITNEGEVRERRASRISIFFKDLNDFPDEPSPLQSSTNDQHSKKPAQTESQSTENEIVRLRKSHSQNTICRKSTLEEKSRRMSAIITSKHLQKQPKDEISPKSQSHHFINTSPLITNQNLPLQQAQSFQKSDGLPASVYYPSIKPGNECDYGYYQSMQAQRGSAYYVSPPPQNPQLLPPPLILQQQLPIQSPHLIYNNHRQSQYLDQSHLQPHQQQLNPYNGYYINSNNSNNNNDYISYPLQSSHPQIQQQQNGYYDGYNRYYDPAYYY